IVVISDGANLSGRTSPGTAALHARSSHIPIYSILVGTENGVITVPLANGFQAQLRVPPSPATLHTVAQVTGGDFLAAPSSASLARGSSSRRLVPRCSTSSPVRAVSSSVVSTPS